MKVTIEISCDTAAFQAGDEMTEVPEVNRMLVTEVKRLLIDYMFKCQAHGEVVDYCMRDIHGNTIGAAVVER